MSTIAGITLDVPSSRRSSSIEQGNPACIKPIDGSAKRNVEATADGHGSTGELVQRAGDEVD
ncbi:uncharacterized protein P174DRAFT_416059 [Aspergillus novofumigatus IBT 16806]|uniref:Uncharacterized protein n=1 Tax=Aspergillus novofumigatus (strain IBT 16806) TaxID=1392255 RepID=A0A2I1CL29_ASPN1|nr:uncharacterized protein P174DRAFT_416059 [Aspergillus novofumigatus IBT 16806]PKX98316.1 hypothetical protein P174DRAFT_416059 [Aspergillus novofumigatus IBT 16806]